MDLINLWDWDDADEFWNKYGQRTNHDAFVSLTSILWYFESVGILLRRKLIDINLIDDLYSDRYIRFWEKIEPILRGIRDDFDNPNYYSNCEYLHNELKLIHKARD
jgi:hypothetical protein